jgi:hypothetical protein
MSDVWMNWRIQGVGSLKSAMAIGRSEGLLSGKETTFSPIRIFVCTLAIR